MHKKGIDAEEDPDEKQKLEEARDERISFLEEKIQNLCFWHDVKDGNIGTPKEGAEARIFPSDSNVYHFHPVAFVEQMKRLMSCCMSDWSYDRLKSIAYLSSNDNIMKHLSGINKAFKDNEINACLRRIHFLAQVLLESGGL